MLSIGVVIPTKNSMPYLPGHLEKMRAWQSLVEEIVVVDSFSSDGTVEFIRSNLSHPRVKFLTHPPGLYESWNRGIGEIGSHHLYIATVGDTIARDGLERLARVAETLACDVVISKPDFRDTAERTLPDVLWPIDDVIGTLGITAPRKLDKLEALVFTAVHATGALLGSCASNLFRTEILKRFPFPTDFGTAGDGAWGLMHAAEVAWGVVPERFSIFLIHPANTSAAERQASHLARRRDEVLRAAMESWRRNGIISDQELAEAGWSDLMRGLTSYLDAKENFDQNRRSAFPWILNPRAWRNRVRRDGLAEQLHTLKRRGLRACPE